MRTIVRQPLAEAVQSDMAEEQLRAIAEAASPGFSADKFWKRVRQRSFLKEDVLGQLRRMAGDRERCMYCSDSHGNDIEHFWPKSTYPEKMLMWTNLLLCCSNCGRLKGDRFPLKNGAPLLIDPAVDKPWDHLSFDPATGNLTARFVTPDQQDDKGAQTVETLKLDQREAIANGYRRSFKRVRKVIDNFVRFPTTIDSLEEDLAVADDHGVLGWIFHGDGQNEVPFSELRDNHRSVWEHFSRQNW